MLGRTSFQSIANRILAGVGCTRWLDTGGWSDTTIRRPFQTRNKMNTKEADKVFSSARQIAAVDGMTDYEREEKRRLEIYQKLKAERLAREATASK